MSLSPILQLLERCRRQQQQIPGQLEIPDEPKSLPANAREAIADSIARKEKRAVASPIRVTNGGWTWATEEEALEEWRSRTYPLDEAW
jgi:hypothetical protein